MEYFTDTYRTNNEKEFYVEHGLIGAPTSPQTANQIQEATSRLNAGVKNVELSLVSPDVFETIPRQHFKEIKRLGELTDSKISLHAPAQMDLAGFQGSQQGVGWSEGQRVQVEENMKNIIDRGAQLGDNAIVTVHSSGGIPAYEWQAQEKIDQEERHPPGDKRKMFVIDQDSKRVMPLEYEEKKEFGGINVWDPEKRRKNMNEVQWHQERLQLFNYEKEKAEINDRIMMLQSEMAPLEAGNKKGILTGEEEKSLEASRRKLQVMVDHIEELNSHVDTQLQDLHDKFARYTPEKKKKVFEAERFDEYNKLVEASKREKDNIKELQDRFSKKHESIYERYGETPEGEVKLQENRMKFMKELEDIRVDREKLLNMIQKMPAPERFVPTDEFAKEKASDTVANSAFHAYNKYGKKAPIISVENVYPDWTLGRADSLRKAIEKSREKFADKLIKEKNLSKDKAKEMSERLIGATWDVGHIGQLRKFGYSDEKIAEEAKKIAPVVKHIHITDNFGFNDTHLPPGYGTLPIEEQLGELKKKLGKEYDKVAHIVEAGGFVAQFKTSPHLPTLEYFDSPLYESRAGPFWKDVAYTHAEYSMGYGLMFPEKHFDLYGSGFSQLPQELGGQVSGDKSRFAGTPNQ